MPTRKRHSDQLLSPGNGMVVNLDRNATAGAGDASKGVELAGELG